MVIEGYHVGGHTIDKMTERRIPIEYIGMALNNQFALKLKADNGATKYILNRKRISSMINHIERMLPKKNGNSEFTELLKKKKELLKRIRDDNGITVVVNDDTKTVITSY